MMLYKTISFLVSNKLGVAISGSKEKYPLEIRLMNSISFACLFGTFVSTLFNIIFKLSLIVTLLSLIAFLIFIPIYYKIRVKNMHGRYFGIQMVILLVALIQSYIYNWGSYGSIPLYFLFFVVLIPIYQNRRFRNILFILTFVSISALLYIEYYFPKVIHYTFESEHQRLNDVFLGVFFASTLIVFIVNTLIKNYKYEREKVVQQNLQIEKMREKEKREHAAKINLFTNISHELRSPLSLIMAPLEILVAEDKDKNRSKQYQLIYENAKKMNQLVDHILDFRKLEMGSMELNLKHIEIVEFIRELALSYSPLAERSNINLSFASNIPETFVNIDIEKIERAISNILNNAFKFTPKNGTIQVVLEENKNFDYPTNKQSDMKPPGVHIKIKDTGTGIPKESLQTIFKPFYQSPNTKYGTGLGLSIAHEIIKLHKGDIMAESKEGVGSCFTIEIPADTNQESAKDVRVNADIIKPGLVSKLHEEYSKEVKDYNKAKKKRAKILVIEDNKEIVDFLFRTLSKNFQVLVAYNGKKGMELAQTNMPELIISDIMMPEMDGLELCKLIKTNEITSHIPVILLTAKSGDEDKVEGLETGADDYITKPFKIKELRARIDNLIELRKKLRERFVKEIFTITPDELSPTSTDAIFLQKAIRTAKANLHQSDFGVAEFVAELGMSRSTLHTKLKQLINQSTSQFLLILRLKKAAEIMRTGNKTISQVSYEVGFNNPAYFTRCFKKLFGKLPSEF